MVNKSFVGMDINILDEDDGGPIEVAPYQYEPLLGAVDANVEESGPDEDSEPEGDNADRVGNTDW